MIEEHHDLKLMHVICAGGVTGYCSRTCGMLTRSRTGML